MRELNISDVHAISGGYAGMISFVGSAVAGAFDYDYKKTLRISFVASVLATPYSFYSAGYSVLGALAIGLPVGAILSIPTTYLGYALGNYLLGDSEQAAS